MIRARLLSPALAVALLLPASRVDAQDTPARQLPPASPRPTPPAPAAAPLPPPANAVALCNDQTFVLAPATPSACDARGGLKLTLPTPRATPALVAPGRAPAPEATVQAAPVPAAPPAGATMRCKDGTWLTGAPDAARCGANGGLAAILPQAPPPPPPPRRP